jgi:catechol 2,3-dioxygenase-like lactoylglutathione lyase family enzyme
VPLRPVGDRSLGVAVNLNHLNLPVPDVAEAAEFFVKFFGFRHAEKKGDALAVLLDDAGFTLILSNFGPNADYPRDFHIGFILESREAVDGLYLKLWAAKLTTEPPKAMHGSWGFYCKEPGGIVIEVSCPR